METDTDTAYVLYCMCAALHSSRESSSTPARDCWHAVTCRAAARAATQLGIPASLQSKSTAGSRSRARCPPAASAEARSPEACLAPDDVDVNAHRQQLIASPRDLRTATHDGRRVRGVCDSVPAKPVFRQPVCEPLPMCSTPGPARTLSVHIPWPALAGHPRGLGWNVRTVDPSNPGDGVPLVWDGTSEGRARWQLGIRPQKPGLRSTMDIGQ
ncbi:hypothetical protein C8Q78DRAFT_207776 [Trametes maxima]|nr:hypothetical protein C8Q78DRAFT_207776 [Trametes maxima]